MGCGSSIMAPMTLGMTDVVGEITGSKAASEAAERAATTQAGAATAGIEEQRRQFEAITAMMEPYLTAGTGALTAQQELAGLAGPESQTAAIAQLQQSPQYQALTQQGEEAMLQSASATGGLRGGNIQGALAQFRPQILSQLIESQYSKLGGMAGQGQQAAGLQGGFGQQTSSNIANLLQQRGAAQAGGQMAAGQAGQQAFQNILGIGGVLSGFMPSSPAAPQTPGTF